VSVVTDRSPDSFGVKIYPEAKLDDEYRAVFVKTERSIKETTIPMMVEATVADVTSFYEKNLTSPQVQGSGETRDIVGTSESDELVVVRVSDAGAGITKFRIVLTQRIAQ
ncbi:MAG: hypothetical protein MUC92_08560, partial [Fimbriimonadaceae bacterium]|nr:hypothetical protein [Fimbriimonadaceae bacterium]